MITPIQNNTIRYLFGNILKKRIESKFNNISLVDFPETSESSILLLLNHFSWWDGFLGGYLNHCYFKKNFYLMMQEDQIKKHHYFRYLGGYSIRKESKEMMISLNYTIRTLESKGNLVLMFPQAELESMHTRSLHLAKGLKYIMDKIGKECQLIYCSVLLDYFESFKPSLTYHFLDYGSILNADFDDLKIKINEFHQEAVKKQCRHHK